MEENCRPLLLTILKGLMAVEWKVLKRLKMLSKLGEEN